MRAGNCCSQGLFLGFALAGTIALAGCGDLVRLNNASGNENGLLVDGQFATGATNDHTFVSSSGDIGKTAGGINIYWVDTVDGGTGRGNACNIGSDFVAIGSANGLELLSHELGHDFALQHVDGQATFDQTNIMHSASNTRQFITEG